MKRPPRYECAVCGMKRPAEEMVFSRWTGNRYCGREFAKCEQRAAKRKRAEKRQMVAA